MNKKQIALVILLVVFLNPIVLFIGGISLQMAIDFALGDPLYASSSMHIKYDVKEPVTCDAVGCRIVLRMTNNNPKPYHLDFFGVDGPGFAERDTWGAYYVGKDQQEYRASPDEASSDKELSPGESMDLTLTSTHVFTTPGDIDHIEIFGMTVDLQ